ncbi:MAG: glycogen synthase GlgA [Candidatus Binatia bacterium]
MISSEIGPFAKTGGLADVVEALAKTLERRGQELCLVMPAYRSVLNGGFALEETENKLSVRVSDRLVEATVLKGRLGNGIVVYFIRAGRYFDRDGLYSTPAKDYSDNAERFVFFSRAALEVLRGQPTDILHCHDWQAALAIFFLRAQERLYPELRSAKTVFTIHNLGFQGLFPETDWHLLNLERHWFAPPHLEFHGKINFLKGGLIFADKITTVSPTYAQEIMTAEQGFGLEGVLRERAPDVTGILNGVDYDLWNPESDRFLPAHYNVRDLSGKRECKRQLRRCVGLPDISGAPVIGIVSRLTAQKGFDLVEKALAPLLGREIQLVVLGTGERRYEKFFTNLSVRYPQKAAARIGFDEPLAHQIEAGSDFFLMPSLYEPCGLSQMYSLKYGTIPIVRAVGGLKDTVEDYDPAKDAGTGIVFAPYEAAALENALNRALQVYADKSGFAALRERAMSKDYSWDRSAATYSSLYQRAML